MGLADARALLAGLATAGVDSEADRRGLRRLALWCNRFTPRCAVDGDGSGGETALMDEVAARLGGLGIEVRLGLADTPGTAWALARFGEADARVAAPDGTRDALADLPVEALRIADEDARLLRRLGLVTVGALDRLPRASLARRFPRRERSGAVLSRLDRALGRRADPLAPTVPPPALLERLTPPEPLIDRAGLDAALAGLMPGLMASLERDGLGVRRLAFWCYRVDAVAIRRAVATARATRDGDRLLRLFRESLGTVDPGFGIDRVALHADRVEPLAPKQDSFVGDGRERGDETSLIDRLTARLGPGAVHRLEPAASHRPEKAERAVDLGREPVPWPTAPGTPQRPFRLFARPEPVDAVAETPDGPPLLFTWRRMRRRVARASGAERIEPEWWTDDRDETVRDYYRVEDTDGRRYWLYRAGLYGEAGTGAPPRWYVHGLYG